MQGRNPVRDAVRAALTAGIATSLLGAPAAATAQGSTAALAPGTAAVQEKLTVTGSRIKRVDPEGPSPISVISREDIEATGKTSLAEVLRGMSFNTYGSFKQTSGSRAQSQAVVSMRGLGGQRTLVLVDGRRITGSPTFSGGAGVNLNTIPLAAVDHIEVLRDGASAVYGTDAIGGVINIVMRNDYDGMHLSYAIGRPTQTGGDEDSYSIVGGVSGAKGNVTFGFENHKKEIVLQGDRDYSSVGLSSYGFPGSYRSELGTFPDPRCPAELGTDEFPNSTLGAPTDSICRYNYASVTATEAGNNTYSVFVNSNYDISETTTFFTRGMLTYNESFGRWAQTPATTPFPTLARDHPNNPTNPANPTNALGDPWPAGSQGIDTDGDGVADVEGPFDITVRFRNVPGGPRDTVVDDTLIDYLAGLQGTVDWLGGLDWELGAQYSQQHSDSDGSGYLLRGALQSQLDSGALDVFAVNTDTGNFSDGLDPDFVAASKAAATTVTSDNETRVVSTDFTVSFDAFQMASGPVPVALGVEYRDEKFTQNFDEQTNSGGVDGAAIGEDQTGARVVKAIFSETTIPVFSMLDVNLAGRYEDYNDFGTTFNPKISAAFRPLDSLLLRASWGEGFRAPSMTELYAGAGLEFDEAIDTFACANTPPGDPDAGRAPGEAPGANLPFGHPCLTTQYQNFQGGNRNLDPEESTSWTAGLVWNPVDGVSLELDWFDIELENEIGVPAMQTQFDVEFARRQAGDEGVPYSHGRITGVLVGNVVRDPADDSVVMVLRTDSNVARRETDGLDINATVAFSVGVIGDFRTTAQWTYVNEYERDEGDGNGLRDPQFLDPSHRGTIGLNWALGDFGADIFYNYIADAAVHDANGFELRDIDSFETWDMSASYTTVWNGTVTVGARNIFDEDPPTSPSIGSPYYANYLHDPDGRVPYVRYEQDF